MKMIKVLIVLLSMLYFERGKCQSKIENKISFYADYKCSFISSGKTVLSDVCRLEISSDLSYFYSLGESEYISKLQDKIRKAMVSGVSIDLKGDELKADFYKFKVLKDYKLKKAIVVEQIGEQNLAFVKDSLSLKRWIIQKETKIVNGYLCHRAMTEKDGVSISAWFCLELPYREGPHYFYGLPGLILYAESSKGWKFELRSINYLNGMNQKIAPVSYTLTTESKIAKAKLNERLRAKFGEEANGDRLERVKN
ncbi:GLPGLI family protein [Pedobacter sp.]